jgi:Bacterial Ig domain/L,D-transpeptidase catalytic domain
VKPGPTQIVLAFICGAMLLVTGCGGGSGSGNTTKSAAGGGSSAQGGESAKSGTTASEALVTVAPGDGATGVGTTGGLKVTAAKGKLTSVVVRNAHGDAVGGKISAAGTSWTPTGTLTTNTKYTVDAVAKDSGGRETAKHTTFTTLKPAHTFIGTFTPDDGQTVGVGMEVSLNFNRGITDRAAVEKAVKVTASPAVPVVGKWYGNDRIDFRPQTYWKPGTKVTLSLRLDGVQGRPGVYGQQSKDIHFTVGRSQVSVVDAASDVMKIYRDGKLYRTIDITSGAPGHTTYNGKMVISEKYLQTRMNGATVGFAGEYDIPDVPHAMRLTTSGTFIHGNYWAGSSVFGNSNVSHGCVGLRDVKGGYDGSAPAAWFYDHSIIGDVVEVKNSHDTTVQWWNGLNGWNLPWSEWTR